jgi:hypothetical protein
MADIRVPFTVELSPHTVAYLCMDVCMFVYLCLRRHKLAAALVFAASQANSHASVLPHASLCSTESEEKPSVEPCDEFCWVTFVQAHWRRQILPGRGLPERAGEGGNPRHLIGQVD